MKKTIILLILTLYVVSGASIELRVIGVTPNDTLNVRKHASHKSAVVAKLAAFARGFYATKALPKNPSSWVAITIDGTHATIHGWVKRRYVTQDGAYMAVHTSRLALKYPSFAKAYKGKNGSIGITYDIKVRHDGGCDMRDKPEMVSHFAFLAFSFSVHDTLKSALLESFGDQYKNGTFDASLRYDAHRDWFKKHKKNGWVEEVEFYGKRARRIMIGAEGCGINYYFYRQSGKVILVSEPFNHNPPVDPKTNTIFSGKWELPNEDMIMHKIVWSLKVKGRS